MRFGVRAELLDNNAWSCHQCRADEFHHPTEVRLRSQSYQLVGGFNWAFVLSASTS